MSVRAPVQRPEFDVVVVGAGIAGLSARRLLMKRGLAVCVVEKSRGLGGRVSSRRGDGWTADLGAQFMARLHPEWESCVPVAALREVRLPKRPEYPRWCHPDGMSGVAKMIAGDITDVVLQSRVTRIERGSTGWKVVVDTDRKIAARAILVTIPVPQAHELLVASGLDIQPDLVAAVARLKSRSCISVVLNSADARHAVEVSNWPIFWKEPNSELEGIYDQNRKGIRCAQRVIVAHASTSFTAALWNEEPERIKASVGHAVNRFMSSNGLRAGWEPIHVHKWRYSEPEVVHSEACLIVDPDAPLVLAGDAFGRASVDGAFSSGHAAGDVISRALSGYISSPESS